MRSMGEEGVWSVFRKGVDRRGRLNALQAVGIG